MYGFLCVPQVLFTMMVPRNSRAFRLHYAFRSASGHVSRLQKGTARRIDIDESIHIPGITYRDIYFPI